MRAHTHMSTHAPTRALCPLCLLRNIFVIQTAFVYCERFYAKRSLLRNDRFVSMQGCCLLQRQGVYAACRSSCGVGRAR